MDSDRLASVFLGMWAKMNKYNESVNNENLETLKDCVTLMKNHVQEVETRVSKLDYESRIKYEREYMNRRTSKRRRRSVIERELGIDDIDWMDDFDFEILNSSSSEVSDSSCSTPSKKVKSSSLVDPEWEIIDPTPDIHTLFITFNKRFFWGALVSVEVRWSPRMYSCAGLCSYEGRRGMCSVRLSEPLLKLRPRSDLVETLLHEMIHAYLFVTHNNRDRTGHGPEFHKHMYRINNEAGTNITVYHNFHDEVKLYKKHWWRCDGPCQFKPPFMGMVKRTMNRPPGAYDSWWTTHQATCGGKFIKVREPMNTKIKQVKPNISSELTKAGSVKDIRNFFNTPINSQGSNTLPKSNVQSTNPNMQQPSDSSQSSVSSKSKDFPHNKPNGFTASGVKGLNVFGINNSSVNGGSQGIKKPVLGSANTNQGINRVVGFGDLNPVSTKNNSNTTRNVFGGSGQKLGGSSTGNPWKNNRRIGGALLNRGGGTLVVTAKKGKQKTQNEKPSEETKTFVPFNGRGQTLGSASASTAQTLGSASAGTAQTLNSSTIGSRLGGTCSDSNSNVNKLTGRDRYHSVPKFPNKNSTSNSRNNPSSSSCTNGFKSTKSESSSTPSLASGSPQKTELESSFNNSVVTISDEEFADVADFVDFEKDSVDGEDDVHCPVCNMSLKRDDMVMHLENCDALKATMDNINSSSRLENSEVNSDDEVDDDDVEVSEENSHTSQLIKENAESGNGPIFPCPCCSKYFSESQINKHLDECLSLLALQEFGNAF